MTPQNSKVPTFDFFGLGQFHVFSGEVDRHSHPRDVGANSVPAPPPHVFFRVLRDLRVVSWMRMMKNVDFQCCLIAFGDPGVVSGVMENHCFSENQKKTKVGTLDF